VRRRLALLLPICLLPAAVKLVCYPDYPGSDDAFIHLAVVENLRRGAGWGINAGEPVLVSTSPLFTVVFTAIRRLSPRVLEVGMALSLAAACLYVLGVYVLALRIAASAGPALVCAFLAAANVHLWRWNGTFMEVLFATATVPWLVTLFLKRAEQAPEGHEWDYLGLGLGVAAAVLLRPELGLLVPVFFLHCLWHRHPLAGRGCVLFLLGVALLLVPALAVLAAGFGTIVPTTFAAKTVPGLRWVNPQVWSQILLTLLSGSGGALALAAGLWLLEPDAQGRRAALHRLRKWSVVWLFPLAGFAFYALKTAVLQSAARYLLPFVGLLPVLPAVLWPDHPRPRPAALRWLATACCVGQIAVSLLVNQRFVRPALQRMRAEYLPTMAAAVAELSRQARPGDSVLVFMDLGVVSALRPPTLRIVDGGGLASPELRGLTLSAMLRRTRPRWVLESMGTDAGAVEQALRETGRPFRTVWTRPYRSPGVESVYATYEARLFEIIRTP